MHERHKIKKSYKRKMNYKMYQNKIVFQRHSDIYTTFLSYQRLYHKMETKKWYVQNLDHAMYLVKTTVK